MTFFDIALVGIILCAMPVGDMILTMAFYALYRCEGGRHSLSWYVRHSR